MIEIARLETVDLRKVWPDEARDFTPWLAENLDALGEALGINLEFTEIEAPVGPFSLDIRARDADDNRTVVIENQLTKTDHDHLGKALTYAGGFNADVMVWIVSEFQDEHRQALDWLNQRTSEETEFWGVVVRAMRIGNSPSAPIFEVVARPNTFIKSGGQTTETQQAYMRFWPRVLDRLRDHHNLTVRKTSSIRRSWLGFSSDIPGVGGGVNFAGKKGARADLHLSAANKERNKALFDLLHDQHKERVEEAIGEPLSWERLGNRKACRIALYLPGRSIEDSESTLNDTADWMVDRFVRLRQVMIPIVREAAREVDDSIGSISADENPWEEEGKEDGE